MSAKIIEFPPACVASGGQPPMPPPAVDPLTRVSVLELAAAGFRFRSATSDCVLLEHPTYGELRLANGLRKHDS